MVQCLTTLVVSALQIEIPRGMHVPQIVLAVQVLAALVDRHQSPVARNVVHVAEYASTLRPAACDLNDDFRHACNGSTQPVFGRPPVAINLARLCLWPIDEPSQAGLAPVTAGYD